MKQKFLCNFYAVFFKVVDVKDSGQLSEREMGLAIKMALTTEAAPSKL